MVVVVEAIAKSRHKASLIEEEGYCSIIPSQLDYVIEMSYDSFQWGLHLGKHNGYTQLEGDGEWPAIILIPSTKSCVGCSVGGKG